LGRDVRKSVEIIKRIYMILFLLLLVQFWLSTEVIQKEIWCTMNDVKHTIDAQTMYIHTGNVLKR
jgi:hypothetical protein